MDLMKFSKEKHEVLVLGGRIPRKEYRCGVRWTESNFAEKT